MDNNKNVLPTCFLVKCKSIYQYMKPVIRGGNMILSEFVKWDPTTQTIREERGLKTYYKNVIFGFLYVLCVVDAFPSVPPGKIISFATVVYGIECGSLAFLVNVLWLVGYLTQNVHLKLFKLIEETDEIIRSFNIDLSNRNVDRRSDLIVKCYYVAILLATPVFVLGYASNSYERKAIFIKFPLGVIIFYRLLFITAMLMRIGDRVDAVNEILQATSNKMKFPSKRPVVAVIKLLKNIRVIILKQYILFNIFFKDREYEHFNLTSLTAAELFINFVYWTQIIFLGKAYTGSGMAAQFVTMGGVAGMFINTLKICEDQREKTMQTGRLIHRLYLSIEDKFEIREEIKSMSLMLLQHQAKFTIYDLYDLSAAYAFRTLLGVLFFVTFFVQFRITI